MFIGFSFIIFLALLHTYIAEDPANTRGTREIIKIEEAPYIAQYFPDASVTKFCAGFIINKDKVITRAHCIDNKAKVKSKVQVGSVYSENCSMSYDVISSLPHPGYVYRETGLDVGLVEISGRFEWSNSVLPIAMVHEKFSLPHGAHVETYGWRMSEKESKLRLEKTNQVSYTIATCVDIYKNPLKVSKESLCIGSPDLDLCFGGSGGVLVYQGLAAGILAIEDACMRKGTPGVYSNIGKARLWLNSVLC